MVVSIQNSLSQPERLFAPFSLAQLAKPEVPESLKGVVYRIEDALFRAAQMNHKERNNPVVQENSQGQLKSPLGDILIQELGLNSSNDLAKQRAIDTVSYLKELAPTLKDVKQQNAAEALSKYIAEKLGISSFQEPVMEDRPAKPADKKPAKK